MRVKECNPCRLVRWSQVTWYKEDNQVIFHPSIPHNNYYYYNWTFSDGTTYTTREVSKPKYSVLWGTLTIYYADPNGEMDKCC